MPTAPRFDHEDPAEDDVAGLFYSSGTTGGPKGAMLTAEACRSDAFNRKRLQSRAREALPIVSRVVGDVLGQFDSDLHERSIAIVARTLT